MVQRNMIVSTITFGAGTRSQSNTRGCFVQNHKRYDMKLHILETIANVQAVSLEAKLGFLMKFRYRIKGGRQKRNTG